MCVSVSGCVCVFGEVCRLCIQDLRLCRGCISLRPGALCLRRSVRLCVRSVSDVSSKGRTQALVHPVGIGGGVLEGLERHAVSLG